MKLFLHLANICVLLHAVCAASFSYDTVAGWPTAFAQSCSGMRQSPINIDSDSAEHQDFDELVISGYDATTGVTQSLENNGHTVQLSLTGDYSISGAGLSTTYNALQLHFHWGSVDSQGSEHTYDGQAYPAEMHIVHVKEGLTVSEAIQDPSGLAVLGVFIEVGSSDNAKFAPLIDAIETLGNVSETLSSNIVLSNLLPYSTDNFYRYDGSLTTPSCNEAVIWTVFQDTITLSETQLDVFRSLQDDYDHIIVDNYRPTQNINDRVIYKSYSGASIPTFSFIAVMVAAIVVRLSM